MRSDNVDGGVGILILILRVAVGGEGSFVCLLEEVRRGYPGRTGRTLPGLRIAGGSEYEYIAEDMARILRGRCADISPHSAHILSSLRR